MQLACVGSAETSCRSKGAGINRSCFHFVQILACAWYWLGAIITDSYIIDFVVCLVLLALDFWVVSAKASCNAVPAL